MNTGGPGAGPGVRAPENPEGGEILPPEQEALQSQRDQWLIEGALSERATEVISAVLEAASAETVFGGVETERPEELFQEIQKEAEKIANEPLSEDPEEREKQMRNSPLWYASSPKAQQLGNSIIDELIATAVQQHILRLHINPIETQSEYEQVMNTGPAQVLSMIQENGINMSEEQKETISLMGMAYAEGLRDTPLGRVIQASWEHALQTLSQWEFSEGVREPIAVLEREELQTLAPSADAEEGSVEEAGGDAEEGSKEETSKTFLESLESLAQNFDKIEDPRMKIALSGAGVGLAAILAMQFFDEEDGGMKKAGFGLGAGVSGLLGLGMILPKEQRDELFAFAKENLPLLGGLSSITSMMGQQAVEAATEVATEAKEGVGRAFDEWKQEAASILNLRGKPAVASAIQGLTLPPDTPEDASLANVLQENPGFFLQQVSLGAIAEAEGEGSGALASYQESMREVAIMMGLPEDAIAQTTAEAGWYQNHIRGLQDAINRAIQTVEDRFDGMTEVPTEKREVYAEQLTLLQDYLHTTQEDHAQRPGYEKLTGYIQEALVSLSGGKGEIRLDAIQRLWSIVISGELNVERYGVLEEGDRSLQRDFVIFRDYAGREVASLTEVRAYQEVSTAESIELMGIKLLSSLRRLMPPLEAFTDSTNQLVDTNAGEYRASLRQMTSKEGQKTLIEEALKEGEERGLTGEALGAFGKMYLAAKIVSVALLKSHARSLLVPGSLMTMSIGIEIFQAHGIWLNEGVRSNAQELATEARAQMIESYETIARTGEREAVDGALKQGGGVMSKAWEFFMGDVLPEESLTEEEHAQWEEAVEKIGSLVSTREYGGDGIERAYGNIVLNILSELMSSTEEGQMTLSGTKLKMALSRLMEAGIRVRLLDGEPVGAQFRVLIGEGEGKFELPALSFNPTNLETEGVLARNLAEFYYENYQDLSDKFHKTYGENEAFNEQYRPLGEILDEMKGLITPPERLMEEEYRTALIHKETELIQAMQQMRDAEGSPVFEVDDPFFQPLTDYNHAKGTGITWRAESSQQMLLYRSDIGLQELKDLSEYYDDTSGWEGSVLELPRSFLQTSPFMRELVQNISKENIPPGHPVHRILHELENNPEMTLSMEDQWAIFALAWEEGMISEESIFPQFLGNGVMALVGTGGEMIMEGAIKSFVALPSWAASQVGLGPWIEELGMEEYGIEAKDGPALLTFLDTIAEYSGYLVLTGALSVVQAIRRASYQLKMTSRLGIFSSTVFRNINPPIYDLLEKFAKSTLGEALEVGHVGWHYGGGIEGRKRALGERSALTSSIGSRIGVRKEALGNIGLKRRWLIVPTISARMGHHMSINSSVDGYMLMMHEAENLTGTARERAQERLPDAIKRVKKGIRDLYYSTSSRREAHMRIAAKTLAGPGATPEVVEGVHQRLMQRLEEVYNGGVDLDEWKINDILEERFQRVTGRSIRITASDRNPEAERASTRDAPEQRAESGRRVDPTPDATGAAAGNSTQRPTSPGGFDGSAARDLNTPPLEDTTEVPTERPRPRLTVIEDGLSQQSPRAPSEGPRPDLEVIDGDRTLPPEASDALRRGDLQGAQAELEKAGRYDVSGKIGRMALHGIAVADIGLLLMEIGDAKDTGQEILTFGTQGAIWNAALATRTLAVAGSLGVLLAADLVMSLYGEQGLIAMGIQKADQWAVSPLAEYLGEEYGYARISGILDNGVVSGRGLMEDLATGMGVREWVRPQDPVLGVRTGLGMTLESDPPGRSEVEEHVREWNAEISERGRDMAGQYPALQERREQAYARVLHEFYTREATDRAIRMVNIEAGVSGARSVLQELIPHAEGQEVGPQELYKVFTLLKDYDQAREAELQLQSEIEILEENTLSEARVYNELVNIEEAFARLRQSDEGFLSGAPQDARLSVQTIRTLERILVNHRALMALGGLYDGAVRSMMTYDAEKSLDRWGDLQKALGWAEQYRSAREQEIAGAQAATLEGMSMAP